MDININGHAADVTLENEKTVGEVMASLDQWLAASGHRLSGISIDGQTAHTSLLDDFFSREINSVNKLDLYTSSLAELTAESLLNILYDIKEFEKLGFEEKKNFFSDWKKSAQANFIAEQIPDLYNIFTNSFSGGDINPGSLFSITEERLREVKDPMAEYLNIRPLLEDTCTRLSNLALDIQTGKDAQAARSIQLFSGVSEKILRIIRHLDMQGYLYNGANGEKPFIKVIGEFGSLIKELLDAYERHDTVLAGDLAEYEAVPKIQELYNAIIKNCSQKTAVQDEK